MTFRQVKRLLAAGYIAACIGAIGAPAEGWAQADLSAEARSICEQMFARDWQQQGDNWFTGHEIGGSTGGFAQPLGAAAPSVVYVEAHNVTLQMIPQGVSTADTMNGLDFKGGGMFFAEAFRMTQNGQWMPWHGKSPIYQCLLTHQQGRWIPNHADNILPQGRVIPADRLRPPQ